MLLAWLGGLATGCGDGPTSPGSARLRILHASYDAPAVAVTIDNGAVVPSVAFGTASSYLSLAPGLHDLVFSDAGGDKKRLHSSGVNAGSRDYTVYLLNAAEKIETTVSLDERSSAPEQAKVRLVHAWPDAGAVDLRRDTFAGPPLFENVAFRGATAYAELDEQAYHLVLLKTPAQGVPPAATDVLATFDPITFEKGKSYTIIGLGTVSSSDAHDFLLRVFTDSGAGDTSTDLVRRTSP